MRNGYENQRYSKILNIIIWGALWGIFESTVGYLLHSISFGYSWVIWYPFACFIMTNVYRKNKSLSSIFYVGLFCATIKMLNLFLPGRIDRVINPAISIVLEAIAMVCVMFIVNLYLKEKQKNSFIQGLLVFVMNTGWRAMFILYLLFFVPDWIRDVSVISSAEKFIQFFITQNLVTSAFIFVGYKYKAVLLNGVEIIENRISIWTQTVPNKAIPVLQTSLATFMICVNIALQFILK
ncbi:hypothetical protein [Anaerotignum propionicum]|uniref:Uncharacterized protein n=1 Tax=Anaerotignum propionicum DSM 1682 TaxID=991789 RepID=A0A0X1U8J0_ANAPI|nr:hypothetical protein [Anaerotignum propionicum]AMJ41244.1 hypothetical protein CPRO_16540 [Anaerotignum propionicum DSM 1682]SHF11600.1 hypothetical protein SAMN02745151_02827 [[Clostridium] propionicum DSM 1682] [Anaerotignum propionicum DSM 1682]